MENLQLIYLTYSDLSIELYLNIRNLAKDTQPVSIHGIALFNIHNILDHIRTQDIAMLILDDKIIGYCIIANNEIVMVEIHPYFQRRGFCSKLMNFVFNQLRSRGINKISLYNVGGEAAYRCYKYGAELYDDDNHIYFTAK